MRGLRRATVQRIVAVVTALLMASSLSSACRWPANPWPGGTTPATRLRQGLTQAEVAAVLADAWYHAECGKAHVYTNPPADTLEEIYLYGPQNQQQVGVVVVIYDEVSTGFYRVSNFGGPNEFEFGEESRNAWFDEHRHCLPAGLER